MLAVERHQPAIAERDLALGFARIVVLADRDQLAVLDQQPAIAGRIRRRESGNRDRGAVGQRRAQLLQGLGAHQRRVGEHHQDIVEAARDGVARRQHRMRGAEPLHLACDLRVRESAATPLSRPHRDSGPITTAQACAPASRTARSTWLSSVCPPISCITFGKRRAHAGALTRRQHHRKTCPVRHIPVSGSVSGCGHSGARPRRKAVGRRRKAGVCPPLLLAFWSTDSFEDHDAQAAGPYPSTTRAIARRSTCAASPFSASGAERRLWACSWSPSPRITESGQRRLALAFQRRQPRRGWWKSAGPRLAMPTSRIDGSPISFAIFPRTATGCSRA